MENFQTVEDGQGIEEDGPDRADSDPPEPSLVIDHDRCLGDGETLVVEVGEKFKVEGVALDQESGKDGGEGLALK